MYLIDKTDLDEKYLTEEEYLTDEDNLPFEENYWPWFERIYFFVMLIYAAQMTPETGRMLQEISGNPIPFLIPIIFTVILLIRNPISYKDKSLWVVLGCTSLWTVASLIKHNTFTTQELSYYFFLYYALIIAYIHVKVFGSSLPDMYENAMTFVAKITLPIWFLCLLFPSTTQSFFEQFPETIFGHNFLYIFNKINPEEWEGIGYFFLRNAGFSWEPGRFSIMLCVAILFNIYRNGVTFVHNKNIYWLLAALISTQSTTGYSIVLVIYVAFTLSKISIKNTFIIAIMIPLIYYIFSLDFMYRKMAEHVEKTEKTEQTIKYQSTKSETIALDRLPSFLIQYSGFLEDPLLGHSRNMGNSKVYSYLPDNIQLTGGLMLMFSMYGIFMASFYYGILIYSSIIFGRQYQKNRFVFAICYLLCTFSYPLFCVPLFTAFWFYGLYYTKQEEYEDYPDYDELEYCEELTK